MAFVSGLSWDAATLALATGLAGVSAVAAAFIGAWALAQQTGRVARQSAEEEGARYSRERRSLALALWGEVRTFGSFAEIRRRTLESALGSAKEVHPDDLRALTFPSPTIFETCGNKIGLLPGLLANNVAMFFHYCLDTNVTLSSAIAKGVPVGRADAQMQIIQFQNYSQLAVVLANQLMDFANRFAREGDEPVPFTPDQFSQPSNGPPSAPRR